MRHHKILACFLFVLMVGMAVTVYGEDFDRLKRLGMEAQERGDCKDAIEFYNKALNFAPETEKALINSKIAECEQLISTKKEPKTYGVKALNLNQLHVAHTITTGTQPITVALVDNGKKAYVSNFGSNSISVLMNDQPYRTINVGTNPSGMALTGDERMLLVSISGENKITLIDTTSDVVIGDIITGGQWPVGLTVSKNDKYAYVANYSSNTVSVIDIQGRYTVKQINVGVNPFFVALTPDNRYLFVSCYGGGSVSVINVDSGSLQKDITVGAGPTGISVSPDGKFVYVANYSGNSVSVINAQTQVVVDTWQVGANPYFVVVSPSNSEVIMTFQGGQAVEIRQGSSKKTIELGMNSTGAAFTKDNSKIYVVNFNNGQLTIIE